MKNALVFQSDFGLSDGAVSAMYGVALKVDSDLRIFDITHDIPPYNVWEASYRLVQTLGYWPVGTVFVSVVDPGVGSNRRSVVAKTKSGHLVVTPDNGTLTHVQAFYGIESVRLLDENTNRLAGSELSYTFHGRDVYAYTGARLATDLLAFESVVVALDQAILFKLPLVPAQREGDLLSGTIDALDVRFGSLWSNIPYELFEGLHIPYGGKVEVSIRNDTREVYRNTMTYARSFADVNVGEPLVYINSLLHVALAINQGAFSRAYNIGTGLSWKIQIRRAPKIVYE